MKLLCLDVQISKESVSQRKGLILSSKPFSLNQSDSVPLFEDPVGRAMDGVLEAVGGVENIF